MAKLRGIVCQNLNCKRKEEESDEKLKEMKRIILNLEDEIERKQNSVESLR